MCILAEIQFVGDIEIEIIPIFHRTLRRNFTSSSAIHFPKSLTSLSLLMPYNEAILKPRTLVYTRYYNIKKIYCHFRLNSRGKLKNRSEKNKIILAS